MENLDLRSDFERDVDGLLLYSKTFFLAFKIARALFFVPVSKAVEINVGFLVLKSASSAHFLRRLVL
jgi:hypothetical protein